MSLKLATLVLLVCAVSAQILPPTGIRRIRPGPIIQTANGPIQGQEETYDIFRRINTFKGIRYAQPPVGNLRFRQGVPPIPWQTTYQAWNYGNRCPQYTLLLNRFVGNEDCLFLNIATPTNIRNRLPVVVSIHGGGLQFGGGEMGFLGPELINQENVIFVSFNYRLNVLGFLNTNDINSPGNYGIKDMIMVLQWVRNNIGNFGGDPNNVSIMGISGGAVGVHALVLSPAAAGLFHRALSQSGSLFNNWAFNRNPLSSAQMLTRNLELQVSGNADLLNQLRQVSVERLLAAAGLQFETSPTLFEELNFMPSLDPPNTNEMRIFTAPPSLMARLGAINQVPYMIGFNSIESLSQLTIYLEDPTVMERFNQNPNLLIPSEWSSIRGTQDGNDVIQAFRALYFGGATTLTPEHAWQWANYVSDREFIFGVSKQARLHTARQPVYYFRFGYSGSLSFAQRLFRLTMFNDAMHGDDAFYLFRLNVAATPVLPNDEAFTVQRRYVRLWTNFFKYSNPTPTLFDPLINENWPLMGQNVSFLDIGSDIVPDVSPYQARMNTWEAFDNRFNP